MARRYFLNKSNNPSKNGLLASDFQMKFLGSSHLILAVAPIDITKEFTGTKSVLKDISVLIESQNDSKGSKG